jgi:hypothetical protein
MARRAKRGQLSPNLRAGNRGIALTRCLAFGVPFHRIPYSRRPHAAVATALAQQRQQ